MEHNDAHNRIYSLITNASISINDYIFDYQIKWHYNRLHLWLTSIRIFTNDDIGD
jgi:hypothetical protein